MKLLVKCMIITRYFIKERKHSNVNLVAKAVFKNVHWMIISFQSMKEIMNQNFISIYEENKPFKCEFCGYSW